MSKYNLIDILEGMSNDEFSAAKEADRLEAHPDKDKIKAMQAMIAKERESQKLKKEMNIKEVRVDREVAERIEGLTNQELKRKFLFAFEDLYSDLTEEDPFHAEDVINHLNNEMHKHLKDYQDAGGKLEEAIPGENEDGTPKSNDEMGDDELEDFYNDLDSVDEGKVSMKDVVLSIIKDTEATNPEVQMYIDSLTNDIKLNGKEAYADYEVDDYIEDFKEYISNKSLQEHFGRFMKDYQ